MKTMIKMDGIIVNQKIRWIKVRTMYWLTEEEVKVVEGKNLMTQF